MTLAEGITAQSISRDEAIARITFEIVDCVVSSLMLGRRKLVPTMIGQDETGIEAYMVLFDHIGDEKAEQMMRDLLAGPNPARVASLLGYAAHRHAHMHAEYILDARSKQESAL